MRILLATLILAAPAAAQQDPEFNERVFQVLERRFRETPDPTDPRAAAARLGFDRERIVAFVAGLSWEPYAGILRDASGTLLAGGGNSVDRALLLQTMLEACGEKTRLVRCDVAEADGGRLLAAFRNRERKPFRGADLKALALEAGVDGATLEAMAASNRRKDSDLVQEILEAGKSEAARLAPLAGPVPGLPASPPREHVWVQVWDAAKKDWIDRDPSPVELPHPALRPVTPQELGAQRRSVIFRLIMNRKTGEKLDAVPLLSVPVDPSLISWKPVDFLLLPNTGQLPPMAKLRELDAKGRVEAFRKIKIFRPGLMVDGKNFGGVPFNLQGGTYDVDAGGNVGTAKLVGAAVGKAFGGAFGGGEEKEAPPTGVESLVLEVTIKNPGAAELVQRRTLYSSAKAADGVAMLPLLRISFLVDGAPLPEGERARREASRMLRNLPAIRDLLKAAPQGIRANPTAEPSSLLLHFADLRRKALVLLSEGAPALQDRPGLCAETGQIGIDEKGGRMIMRCGIDILDNPVRFEDGGRTLRYGLAETALECLLAARHWAEDASPSAWTSIERARLQGGAPEVRDREGRKEIRWSAAAWWSLDPTSGNCVGRVPSGAGQAMVEHAWHIAHEVCEWIEMGAEMLHASSEAKVVGHGYGHGGEVVANACAAVSGTGPRKMAEHEMKEVGKEAVEGIMGALSGGGE